MSLLVGASNLGHAFGARPLFAGITFSISEGERVGLIGPNGAGKSTLLRILAGRTSPDEGRLTLRKGLRVGYLEQVPEFREGANVRESVAEGVGSSHDSGDALRVEEMLSRLDLAELADRKISTLSGGWKKRVALARELAKGPELLLLDEPTNHLDVQSILWLEDFLSRADLATLTITHDRAFLQKVSTRILELDRRNPHGLLSVEGDYAQYLEVKQSMMTAQESRETRLRNVLKRETEWLRQGAKARTTKQQARIQAAGRLEDEVEELATRNQQRKSKIEFESSGRAPKKLIEAVDVEKSYNGVVTVPKLSLKITPQSRLGLLGTNGCGKSTLIRMLLGEEDPDRGSVMRSDQLKVSYFEQNRDSLDPNRTLLRTVCPSGDSVVYRGRSIHARGYLERFLFSPGQMEMTVGKLSGGEQSRMLLALLMLEECNVLVLDEPTNDLDLETLALLQDTLEEFEGAVVLVTHDRVFLDQVASEILAWSGEDKNKRITRYASLSQWEQAYRSEQLTRIKSPPPATPAASAPRVGKKKLSYKDQRELDGIEGVIQETEEKLRKVTEESARPEIQSDAKKLTELTAQMGTLQAEVERLYARWSELEG